ncbi:hypothetical protein [uncultured Candidatus Kuenenia sp.]|uniref:hypothetical protein n=1 Tax=uncultured Candidatus Kuenenia sp. TaxID=1048336 RepID=UPI0002E14B74|nr:hypothetical protein [uncultured Candidatus Kuenenia sp.]
MSHAKAADKEKKEEYNQYKMHLLDARKTTFQQLDKAIFTLSGGGLGLSIAFLKDIVSIKQAAWLYLLFSSWSLFIASIILTLVSFLSSWVAIDKQLNFAEEYYNQDNTSILSKTNKASILTITLNIISVVCFVIAVILIVLFISKNLLKERVMNKRYDANVMQELEGLGGYVPPMMQKGKSIMVEKKGFVPNKLPKDSGKTSSTNSDQNKKPKPKTNNSDRQLTIIT